VPLRIRSEQDQARKAGQCNDHRECTGHGNGGYGHDQQNEAHREFANLTVNQACAHDISWVEGGDQAWSLRQLTQYMVSGMTESRSCGIEFPHVAHNP
jgi:hypothetical protein